MTLSLPDMILESCRVVFQLLTVMLTLEPGALEYRVNIRAKICRWGFLPQVHQSYLNWSNSM